MTLRDIPPPPGGVLLVGINPGLRSAALGHHFAGHSNRFWRLLHAAGLVAEPLSWQDDGRLPHFGLGITNLVARATAGSSELSTTELRAGAQSLIRKVRRWDPAVVALIGVTVYRAINPTPGRVACGLRGDRIGGARIFVLPNPSGRNAHYSYDDMLRAYRDLRSLTSS